MTKASEYQACKREPEKLTAPSTGQLLPTPPDILGPFYRPGSPQHRSRVTLADSATLEVFGRVIDQFGDAIPDVVVDWWQANEQGQYDNDGFTLRARVLPGPGSYYVVHTVMPGHYDISDPDTPEPHEFRCAHLHAIVTAPGFKPLTTQLYFADSKYDDTDRWFDPRRCVKPVDGNPGRVKFDFVLVRSES